MGRSKGVVHVDVAEGGQLLSEFGNLGFIGLDFLAVLDALAFFFDVVPQVLKQQHLTVG